MKTYRKAKNEEENCKQQDNDSSVSDLMGPSLNSGRMKNPFNAITNIWRGDLYKSATMDVLGLPKSVNTEFSSRKRSYGGGSENEPSESLSN